MTLEGVTFSNIVRLTHLDMRIETVTCELVKDVYGAVSETFVSSFMKSSRCGAPGTHYTSDLRAGGSNL